jgi:RNA polymerase sigma-70 factor (ECF subfamily)
LDFVQVYQAQLAPVWRYVRSRIANRDEAQDVTSEVFARAWRSWGRFDPGRGSVAPWLLRIAQRTVVDWNRRYGRPGSESIDLDLIENASSDPSELPESVLLAKEVLIEVNQALLELSDRERDGIALRFGAGLKMADVGMVLGLSTAATKMMIARSLTKVAAALARRQGREPVEEPPLVLADLVDQALRRGRTALPTPELADLVLQLAVIHRPNMPADLPAQVQVCVDCATGAASRIRARFRSASAAAPPPARRLSPLISAAFAWAPLSPICLACTIPVLIVPLLALGMSLDVGYGLHALSLVTAPLVVLVLWGHFRRHGRQLGLLVGGAGAAMLVAHLVGHLVVMDGVPDWSVVADRVGTVLLLAGTMLDAISLNQWVDSQRKRLAVAASAFRLAPA